MPIPQPTFFNKWVFCSRHISSTNILRERKMDWKRWRIISGLPLHFFFYFLFYFVMSVNARIHKSLQHVSSITKWIYSLQLSALPNVLQIYFAKYISISIRKALIKFVIFQQNNLNGYYHTSLYTILRCLMARGYDIKYNSNSKVYVNGKNKLMP